MLSEISQGHRGRGCIITLRIDFRKVEYIKVEQNGDYQGWEWTGRH